MPRGTEWPARMPIRTYNRDFDVPRSSARLGLLEMALSQVPGSLSFDQVFLSGEAREQRPCIAQKACPG